MTWAHRARSSRRRDTNPSRRSGPPNATIDGRAMTVLSRSKNAASTRSRIGSCVQRHHPLPFMHLRCTSCSGRFPQPITEGEPIVLIAYWAAKGGSGATVLAAAHALAAAVAGPTLAVDLDG